MTDNPFIGMGDEPEEKPAPSDPEDLLTNLARRFVSLRDQKAELNAQLKDLNERIASEEQRLFNLMIERSLSKITLDLPEGRRTLYVREDSLVSPAFGHKEDLIEALRKYGMEHAIGVNSSTLRSMYAEHLKYQQTAGEEGDLMPEEIVQKLIQVRQKHSVRVLSQ
jgi:hypothetical protein